VAAVDLGITGVPLVLLSAWKEVALGAILVGAAAPYVVNRRASLSAVLMRRHPFDLLAIVLVAVVLGTLLVQHSIVAANASRLMLFPVGAYVAIRLGVLRPSGDLSILLVIATGIALLGIVQGWLLSWEFVGTYWALEDRSVPFIFMAQALDGPRSAGTLSSPVEYGTYLAFLIGIAVATALVQLDQRRLALATLPILIVALALSFSRSAILAAFVGCAAIIVVAWSRRLATARVVALILLIAIPAVTISGIVYTNRGGLDLIRSTLLTISGDAGPPPGRAGPSLAPGLHAEEPPGDSSTVDHIASLQEGVRLVQNHPFGVGFGNVGSRVVPGTDDKPTYFAESWYLTMGLSLGWLGLLWAVAWTVGLAGLAIQAIRRRRTSAVGLSLIGAVATVAIVGLLLPTLMEPQIAILPWTLAALAVQETLRGDHQRSPTLPAGG
jgi:hypothetical protein